VLTLHVLQHPYLQYCLASIFKRYANTWFVGQERQVSCNRLASQHSSSDKSLLLLLVGSLTLPVGQEYGCMPGALVLVSPHVPGKGCSSRGSQKGRWLQRREMTGTDTLNQHKEPGSN
jgi:hypothetical protein